MLRLVEVFPLPPFPDATSSHLADRAATAETAGSRRTNSLDSLISASPNASWHRTCTAVRLVGSPPIRPPRIQSILLSHRAFRQEAKRQRARAADASGTVGRRGTSAWASTRERGCWIEVL